MRTSQYLLSTLKETPADAEVISHQLMLRAGMIRKLASGLYTWLPTGVRVLKKVENIVREEMNNAGAIEVLMPVVQPSELWQESGRWEQYGPELLRIADRGDRPFVLGPTHEEVITDLIRNGSPIQSPLNYTLEPVKASLPTTPMAMRGMYFYMADAATFTDCATGKRVAVANNAQLERDYAAARGTDTRPVLLVVEGHFTLEANPDTGEMMKTLMTDQAGKFIPGKDCSH